jgi:thiamine-phosphate pyrophosphorylase
VTIDDGRPTLCLVSDRRAIGERPLVALIGEAARAGVDLIQIRERDLDDRALVALTRAAVATVRGTPARVIVNDRTDVALAAGAAGVHLRSDSIPAGRVRAMSEAGFLVGRSVHDEDEAAAVDAEGGCDYLIFGTVFPSSSKPPAHQAAGLAALSRVCARVKAPVLAIGGISIGRVSDVARAGASGVAAIQLFAGAADLYETVRALRRAFDT